MNKLERARSALNFLNADCPRNEWVQIGMAAKAAGLDFEDFHNWSKNAINYTGGKDCFTAWQSFDNSGRITAATLFHKAIEKEWRYSGIQYLGKMLTSRSISSIYFTKTR